MGFGLLKEVEEVKNVFGGYSRCDGRRYKLSLGKKRHTRGPPADNVIKSNYCDPGGHVTKAMISVCDCGQEEDG